MTARYQHYIASGSRDPYSVWLGDKFVVWLSTRPEKRDTSAPHGVVAETGSEFLRRMLAAHGADFDLWLAENPR